MFLKKLIIKNYRTLEDIKLDFSAYYTAICGRNNSGKSNIVRAIKNIFSFSERFSFSDDTVSYKRDLTAWRKSASSPKPIIFELELEIDKDSDQGLMEFLARFAAMDIDGNTVAEGSPGIPVLKIAIQYPDKDSSRSVKVQYNGIDVDQVASQEIYKKILGSRSLIFHNSADATVFHPFGSYRFEGMMRNISREDQVRVEAKQKALLNSMRKAVDSQRRELDRMIGRLGETFEVRLSIPELRFDSVPTEILLAEKEVEVPLEDWGSGTKNQTLILRSIFSAKGKIEVENISDRIVPIVLIEEPESFLHPSAQANFGRVLQQLAAELKIQVIATTHSPYMLSSELPSANILLTRKKEGRVNFGTAIEPVTEKNWRAPYELALGINSDQFESLKGAVFSKSTDLLLVEGEIDREYFELLRNPDHGIQRLMFEGEIYAYNGVDNLKNEVLLKFIRERFRCVIVTLDLDRCGSVQRNLESLGFKKDKNYFPVGQDKLGCQNIEGLLPREVISKVASDNPDLIQQATNGSVSETKQARSKLKRLYLSEFKSTALPGTASYAAFYQLTKKLNRAIKMLSKAAG